MLSHFTRVWRRLRGRFSRTHDRDVRDELQLHLDLLTEDYAAHGLSLEDARARARREFGNPTRFREASHELFSFVALEALLKDLRYAIREIRREYPWRSRRLRRCPHSCTALNRPTPNGDRRRGAAVVRRVRGCGPSRTRRGASRSACPAPSRLILGAAEPDRILRWIGFAWLCSCREH